MKTVKIGLMIFALSLFSCGFDPGFIAFGPADIGSAAVLHDTFTLTRTLTAATVSMTVDREPSVNRGKMTAFVDAIAAENPSVRLIVFGETATGWYYDPQDPEGYQRSVAESIEGPTTVLMQAKAQAYGIYIAFGIAELDGESIYNTALLIGPGGDVIAKHRKVFLTDWDKADGFTPGAGITVTEIDGIKTGIMICYDFHLISSYIAMTGAKPDIIIGLIADLDDDKTNFDLLSRAYNAWTVFANRLGDEAGNYYEGHHGINDPAGNMRVHRNNTEGYLVYPIEVVE